MPWDKNGIPDRKALLGDVFHFHREVWKDELYDDEVEYDKEVVFHVDEGHPGDDDVVCLNSTFGRCFDEESRPHNKEKEIEFGRWLQKIMVPCRRYQSGDEKLNPVVHFLVTTLGHGWVGGTLTGETWT